jgi:hypothetical protein
MLQLVNHTRYDQYISKAISWNVEIYKINMALHFFYLTTLVTDQTELFVE